MAQINSSESVKQIKGSKVQQRVWYTFEQPVLGILQICCKNRQLFGHILCSITNCPLQIQPFKPKHNRKIILVSRIIYWSNFPAYPSEKNKADSGFSKNPACHEFQLKCMEEDLKPNSGHKDATLLSSSEKKEYDLKRKKILLSYCHEIR